MTEETESCTLESAVRGHHVYKTTWSLAIGQVLQVEAEDSNASDDDRYAVATCLRDTVVGHMPRELSRGVAFPGARGHFNYANLFFCEVLFTRKFSKISFSHINNLLYGSFQQCMRANGHGTISPVGTVIM